MSISAMIFFFRWGDDVGHFRTLPNDEATPVKSVKVAASSGKGGFFSHAYGDR